MRFSLHDLQHLRRLHMFYGMLGASGGQGQ